MLPILRRLLRPSTPDAPPPRPLVEVGWMDAAHSFDDHSADGTDFGGLTPLVSVGFLVRVTAEFIVLATDRCPADGSVRTSLTIPAGWVVYVRHDAALIRGPRHRLHADAFDLEDDRRAPPQGPLDEGGEAPRVP